MASMIIKPTTIIYTIIICPFNPSSIPIPPRVSSPAKSKFWLVGTLIPQHLQTRPNYIGYTKDVYVYIYIYVCVYQPIYLSI